MNDPFLKLPIDIARRPDLSPAAKIVYAAIVDRIGSNGHAWPGVRRLALDTGTDKSTVERTVDALEAAGLLVVERVNGNPGGKTNTYRIPERPQNADVRKIQTSAKCVSGRPQNADEDVRKMRTEPDPLTRSREHRPICTLKEVATIYEAYPRKVGRGKALEAIRKAMRRLVDRGQPAPAAWLLARVRAFAASPAGQAGQYTPHPTTWFNQERYDDDDAEWQRRTATTSTAVKALPYDIPEDCR